MATSSDVNKNFNLIKSLLVLDGREIPARDANPPKPPKLGAELSDSIGANT